MRDVYHAQLLQTVNSWLPCWKLYKTHNFTTTYHTICTG